MTPDEFDLIARDATEALSSVVDEDWSRRAGTLDWTCRETIDHTIDCAFSYAMQVAARAQSGFLPFGELRSKMVASNTDLLAGLTAVARMMHDVVACAPQGTVASDGVVTLDLSDWCARGAYEIVLHTNDVLSGLEVDWQLRTELCDAIMSSPQLWMFDRTKAILAATSWTKLLVGSGRNAVE
jgi:hypothetical protein